MNAEPANNKNLSEKIPEKIPEKTSEKKSFQLPKTLSRLLGIVVSNWPWKLLALFLAVCLWAGLISQDPTLTRERVFADADVNVVNRETLRRNGMIVLSGLEEENLHARLRVDVPQREYNNVTLTNYNPRVDLSRITEPGEQQLRVTATSSVSYGTVQAVEPAYITVVVDEYVTNYRVPVSVNVVGEYPEGFYGGSFSLDATTVALSGPKSLVDQVSHILVDYNASALKPEAGSVTRALPMRFMDQSGQEVSSDLLEVSSAGVVLRSVTARQTLYPTRMLPVSTLNLTTGEPPRGYHVTEVTVSPSVLRAAGDETVLGDLESLFVDAAMDVSDLTAPATSTLRIKKPTELVYLSSTTVSVAVKVEPVIISSTLSAVRLNARGIGSGLKAVMDAGTVSAVLTGPQLVVESLRPANVSAYVDVSGLEAGTYELPVQFHVEDKDMDSLSFEATPATVTVTLFEI